MKGLILGLTLLLGSLGSASASCNSPIVPAADGSCQAKSKVSAVFLVSETQFWIQTVNTGSFWYYVDVADVGATNFDRMFSQASTSAVKGCDLWFFARNKESSTPDRIIQMATYNTCSYH
jgi:hypothetical protein